MLTEYIHIYSRVRTYVCISAVNEFTFLSIDTCSNTICYID